MSTEAPLGRDAATGQLVRYGLVAGCGYVLAMGLYALLLAVDVPAYPAIIVIFVANGLFNFAGVRLWAFPESGRAPHSELARFAAVAGGSLVINYGVFAILYSGLDVAAVPAQAVAIATAAPFSFVANRLWSFRAER